ncbi:23S rRNA (uracil(1939)-C(5))-methyltransferase RlmD [Picosynechococcus sp. PCC 7117]|uniref:23S rRNA (uracil(1939)-C(5))-methyltransferase RlmD n=1 Tax=Picosynechococcus sp. PCC 7117 TaxID=195498 RepID=UPI0008107F0D|nr:23S rRNA (uracil(1939)-C(5))-methyltransferase RlmD [Picosynechococcus sp. PCC 7117]ANV86498.1 23S rRNA (uracil-5-)-methyltransferase RumA [Picosynechococcus sp. PCC 7117]
MHQGDLIELSIHDLNSQGAGVGRHGDQVVFVPDTVPGDRLQVRIVRLKRQYAIGQLQKVLEPAPERRRPPCIVADKCGGCQWLQVEDSLQQQVKTNEIQQALQRIGGFQDLDIQPILSGDGPLSYRNKATYPLGRSSSMGNVQAGYYRKGSHQLINLNQCPVQDSRLNPLLGNIKIDIQNQGWSIYNETKHQGKLRHLALRIGQRTGEMLLTLISTSADLVNLETQAETWLEEYPGLVGVCLNENPKKGNLIWGDTTKAIAGRPYLEEIFAGLTLKLRPETFFQVNTSAAEALLTAITQQLTFTGEEILVDAYCGVGTFTLPLAKKVQQAIGIEVQASSIQQAWENAHHNDIHNVEFYAGTVESILPSLDVTADIVLLDPPRKGCDRQVLDALLHSKPKQIVYISCNPATLARDLKHLCATQQYQIQWVQPADFFPQTPHVECAVLLNFVET